MRITLGLLPFLTFFAAALVLHLRNRRSPEPPLLRNALIQASALFGLWVVAGTEIFSKLGILFFWPILLWWLLPFLGCTLYLLQHRADLRFRWKLRRPTLAEWSILLPLLTIILFAFLCATCCPPNNYDSYSYHLPRQVIWMQQGNVRHFSTNNLRQISMPPYAEFVGLHILTLANSDRLLNLVQFSAMILMLAPVSLLTKRLGGKPVAQLLACLLVVTGPVIYMEASNTKNDMVVGMWILICAWWLVRLLDGWRLTWFDALLFGSAIGCAADTKGTGPLFVITIVLILTGAMFLRRTRRDFALLVLIGIVSIAITAPQYARNLKNFGHLDGPTVAEGNYPIYNLSHRPGAVMSNIVRNLAWHAAIPYQPFNDGLYSAVVWLHDHVFHIGINDKSTTTPNSYYNRLEFHGPDEDRTGAPVHVLLLLLLPVTLLLARRRISIPISLLLITLSAAGFIIFCAAIKWEEWHTRYYIANTALLCPVFAASLVAAFSSFSAPVVAALAIAILSPMFTSSSRPLFGGGSIFHRDELGNRLCYIGHRDDYLDMAAIAANHHARWIGLATNGDFPDYIFMEILRKRLTPAPKFEYVQAFVTIKGIAEHRPDIILTRPELTSMYLQHSRTQYFLYRRYTSFNLLLPDNDKTQDSYPPFFGWTAREGITDTMGPFPQWQLPFVRWGSYPDTRVAVNVPTAGKYRLFLLMRRNDDPAQTLRVELNGKQIAAHQFNSSFNFEPMRVPLDLKAGDNDLTFRYGSGDKDTAFPRAVLFQNFQVFPAANTGTMAPTTMH